eukprot:764526-Hanusia_phi.AAC.1
MTVDDFTGVRVTGTRIGRGTCPKNHSNWGGWVSGPNDIWPGLAQWHVTDRGTEGDSGMVITLAETAQDTYNFASFLLVLESLTELDNGSIVIVSRDGNGLINMIEEEVNV